MPAATTSSTGGHDATELAMGQAKQSMSSAQTRSDSLTSTTGEASEIQRMSQLTLGSRTTDFQEDRYIFKNVGKRFKDHLKKFGEGLHFTIRHSSESSSSEEGSRPDLSQFEMDKIPADDFEEITRLIWSAFRIPFNAITLSKEGNHPVPVILSLLKV